MAWKKQTPENKATTRCAGCSRYLTEAAWEKVKTVGNDAYCAACLNLKSYEERKELADAVRKGNQEAWEARGKNRAARLAKRQASEERTRELLRKDGRTPDE